MSRGDSHADNPLPVVSRTSASLDTAFDLILCVRFLHRAFNARIPDLLSPGGYILYNTFLDMPGTCAFGRPKGEGHLLQPGELSAAQAVPPSGGVGSGHGGESTTSAASPGAPQVNGDSSSGWFGPSRGFRVLCDEVEVEAQCGRELSLFLACKEGIPTGGTC